METEEGKIRGDGYFVWYRRVGSGGIPLLTLHGGRGRVRPGGPPGQGA